MNVLILWDEDGVHLYRHGWPSRLPHIVSLFEGEGFTVTAALTVEEAIEAMRRQTFQLAVISMTVDYDDSDLPELLENTTPLFIAPSTDGITRNTRLSLEPSIYISGRTDPLTLRAYLRRIFVIVEGKFHLRAAGDTSWQPPHPNTR